MEPLPGHEGPVTEHMKKPAYATATVGLMIRFLIEDATMLRLKPLTLFCSLTLLAVLLVPTPAHAQDRRLRVSFGGATTAGAIDSQPAIAASVGYRFADRFSFDVEVTAADGATGRFFNVPLFGRNTGRAGIVRLGSMMGDSRSGMFVQAPSAGAFARVPSIGVPSSPGGLRIERDGRTTLATFGFRYELPSQVKRFQPYVSGGIGIARTEESLKASPASGTSARPGMNFATRPDVDIDETVTGFATSAGAGASIRIFKQLSADLDTRYFRLDHGRNLGRFGGGVSYRF